MAINNGCCYSWLDWDTHVSEMSSGYLQDAIIEWSDRCKRRQLLIFPQDQTTKITDNLLQKNFWTWNYHEFSPPNFALLAQYNNLSEGEPSSSTLSNTINEESFPKAKIEDARSTDEKVEKESSVSKEHAISGEKRRKRKFAMGVAYPFTVVKPSGVEGDVTLKDINKRILKRPARPIQHPVGNFARLPCASATGSGPSGKSVVSLTKIQTQGRGTIIIIRTKG